MSNKVRILFYKPPWKLKFKYLINWLISVRTLSKYSHCEAWTADSHGLFFMSADQGFQPCHVGYAGTCWTATMRGKDNGTVCRNASGVLDHPENWVYFELDVDNAERYEQAVAFMEFTVRKNKGYATWDVLKFISPIHFPDNERWICSEFVHDFLWCAGISPTEGIVSPGYIYKMLIKMGHEPKELV